MSSINGGPADGWTLHTASDSTTSERCPTTGTVVAIAGCTNSGKTTIAKILTDKFRKDGATVHTIHQDEFFYTEDKVEKINRDDGSFYYNYDCISAVDHKRLLNDIKAASLAYDYIVVEGHMLTEWMEVIALCDRVMFLTLDQEACLRRRIKRTYDPPDVPGYFEEVVWPAYQQHLQRALLTARKNGNISFFDVTTDSDHPSEEFITSLTRSFFDDIVWISNNPLDVEEMMKLLTSPASGPTSMFAEATPDVCGGKKVLRHYYESDDEMAHKELRNICGRIRNKYPAVERVVIFHRIGAIPAGETSLLIATSSAYQEDALCATKMAFDEIRKMKSIRKKVICEDDVNASEGNNERCNGSAHKDSVVDVRSTQTNGHIHHLYRPEKEERASEEDT